MKNKIFHNTLSSLTYQIIAVMCGFVLPRLILVNYGSEVNGLVNSISQFLTIITYFELGMGAVVPSALYGPLVNNDSKEISKIVVSANKFYHTLANGLLVYVVGLSIIYPIIVGGSLSFDFIASLIIVMSISSFAQYYFGIVDRLLITADQKGYIYYNTLSVTLIINTFVSALIISHGGSIQLVKFVTSIIYLFRPFVFRQYVNKHYCIDRKVKYDKEPLTQKWNGIAQHIAQIILVGSDTIVLTIFSDLKNVSIYSVYYLVINGINSIFTSFIQGVHHAMGELIAKKQLDELTRMFSWLEWLFHALAVFAFGCMLMLIVPFVKVYTSGVNDIIYENYPFAIIMSFAFFFYCVRLPYNSVILAGNHYKQTQHIYIIAAVVNLLISILTVRLFGLVGVAVGTLVAMIYQIIHMSFYLSKNIIFWPKANVFKQLFVDFLGFILGILLTSFFTLEAASYYYWSKLALINVVVWFFVVVLVNGIFYKQNLIMALRKVCGKLNKSGR